MRDEYIRSAYRVMLAQAHLAWRYTMAIQCSDYPVWCKYFTGSAHIIKVVVDILLAGLSLEEKPDTSHVREEILIKTLDVMKSEVVADIADHAVRFYSSKPQPPRVNDYSNEYSSYQRRVQRLEKLRGGKEAIKLSKGLELILMSIIEKLNDNPFTVEGGTTEHGDHHNISVLNFKHTGLYITSMESGSDLVVMAPISEAEHKALKGGNVCAGRLFARTGDVWVTTHEQLHEGFGEDPINIFSPIPDTNFPIDTKEDGPFAFTPEELLTSARKNPLYIRVITRPATLTDRERREGWISKKCNIAAVRELYPPILDQPVFL